MLDLPTSTEALVKTRGRNGSVSLGWDTLIVQEDVAQWLR